MRPFVDEERDRTGSMLPYLAVVVVIAVAMALGLVWLTMSD